MALLDTLECHWKLNEASGTRVDAYGSEDLTAFGTMTSAAGKIGDAADFNGTTDVLAILNSTVLEFGSDDSFAFAFWVKFDALGDYKIILSRSNPDVPSAGAQFLYRVYYDIVSDRIIFNVGNGSSSAEVRANNLGSPTTGMWYFITVWHDASGNEINIQVNNGLIDTVSWSGGTQGGGVNTYFRLGDQGGGLLLDGLLDSVSFFKDGFPDQDDRDQLWNDGDGLDLEDFDAVGGGTTNPWNYYAQTG